MASKLKQFLGEVHNRSTWQILVGYAAGSWVLLGASGTAMDVIGLPDWVPSFTFLICLMGLPLVLATAVIQRSDSRLEAKGDDKEPGRLRRWLTWRHVGIALALAFGILTAGTSGYMGMRVLGIGPVGTLLARGSLSERDAVVISDFDNRSQDSLLAIAVTHVLRVDQREMKVIEIVDESFISEVLGLMAVPTETTLSEDLAREVAVREGIKAVIAGDLPP